MNQRASEQRKEVISMLIFRDGILVLVALNLAVNTAIGLLILLRWRCPVRPSPVLRPD